ncbi:MAG: hypothetical protein HY549_12210 [Elusimicrobia bacterium]|nr:hypothetical protein [Elusimicrobiota bacterium]
MTSVLDQRGLRAVASGPGQHQEMRCCLGQTTVEYLLTTLILFMLFFSMFGFLQGQLKELFTKAAIAILMSYPIR